MKSLILFLSFLAISCVSRASEATANVGQEVTISVTADGTQPFFYQWLKGGFALGGAAQSSTYVLKNVQVADAGAYSCRISNSAGQTISDTATVTVIAPPVVITPPKVVAPNNGRTTTSVK